MEIEVPKDVRPIMLDDAEETLLGDPEGARKQYRYSNLHIREYDDKYTLHVDRFDPRQEPIKHLLFDAPEVLIGTALGIYTGYKVVSSIASNNSKAGILLGALVAAASGYASYRIVKWVKRML